MPKIGVQMSTIKNEINTLGVEGTFKKLNELGFTSVEVSQIPMTKENIELMKECSKKYNVSIDALSAGMDPMMPGTESISTHFDTVVDWCKELDCKFVRIGMLPMDSMANIERVKVFALRCEKYANKFAEHGIKLYYHTHHVEFIKYDGKFMMDIIREIAPTLGLELDIHWMQRGGVNPKEYIKSCEGVVDIIHLKDYRIVEPDMSPIYKMDFAGFFANFQNTIQFAEVGEGNLDIKGIIDVADSVGAIYYFIEQDDTYGRDPWESLAISKRNLEALGFGEWF